MKHFLLQRLCLLPGRSRRDKGVRNIYLFWFPSGGFIKVTGQERMDAYRAKGPIIVNKGIPNEAFRLLFPPGTRVDDELKGRRYTVKPTQEQLDEMLPAKN